MDEVKITIDPDKPMIPPMAITEPKIDLFFGFLATTGRFRHSSIMAGIEPHALARLIKQDTALQERKLGALQEYCEVIDAEIHRRAIEGVPHGVYYKGVRVDEEIQYSDRLLELLAKANNPKYRDRVNIDANVKAGVLVVQASLDPAEWEKEYGSIDPDEGGTGSGRTKSVEFSEVDEG